MTNCEEHIRYVSLNKIISTKKIKQIIFKGKIVVFRDFPQINEINNLSKLYFKNIFQKEFNDFLVSKEKKNDYLHRLIITYQKKIKTCKMKKKAFSCFLDNMQFDLKDTFCDKITLRFSPEVNTSPAGLLKRIGPHRDTWASNVFHQINWWFPIHDVEKDHSIYIAPYYFNKKVKNNSYDWNYELYKKNKQTLSSPVSNIKLENQNKIKLDIKSGEILCFSGNHIHGSSIGLKKRLNLETRTACSKDPKTFKIPENLDSNSKKKKYEWFKSLSDNSSYPDI